MFLLDYFSEIMLGLILGLYLLQAYSNLFMSKDTGNIDLMDAYCRRQLDLKYRSKGLGKYNEKT